MTTKTKSAKKARTPKPTTNGKSTRWSNPEKRALFETVAYAVANTSVTGAAGVNAATLKSLLVKIRVMGYDKLEAAPAKA